MPLQKYIFNPGINKEGTDYTAEGGWFDGNLVRFRKGLPEKIGGWVKFITASLAELMARSNFSFSKNVNPISRKICPLTLFT